MPQPTARRLKVASHFARLSSSFGRPAKITAALRLQGDWLAAAGFPPGAVAQVEVQAGRLVITPAAPIQ